MRNETADNDWRALVDSAISLLRNGRPEQALVQLQQAFARAPGERNVRYWLGNACRATGDTRRAREIFSALLAENPADYDTSFALAFLLRESGAPAEAADVLLKASGQPGISLQQLLQLAGFLRDSGQFGAAIEVMEEAIELSPGQAELHFKLARLFQGTGAFDRALDELRKTLDLDASIGPAWIALAQQKRFEAADDADLQRLQAAARRSHGREADACIAFALGKACDDLQQWPEAWAQYSKGNRLVAEASPWNPPAWSNFIDRTIAGSGRPGGKRSPDPDRLRNAVFIVGMPRSGTTLLEQMLDRHPSISGRGELNFLGEFAVQSASQPLNERARRQMADFLWAQMRLQGPENGFYIDKNPLNFRHLGLLFELIPTARVLHITRDARSSCLSCYFHMFQHKDLAFTYRLDHLLEFYAGYRRMMAYWQQAYPDRILELDYDELVEWPEKTLVRTLQFLGTDWNDAVLGEDDSARVVRTASVWQARQPVHRRSRERWRNYYGQASEFFDALEELDSG